MKKKKKRKKDPEIKQQPQRLVAEKGETDALYQPRFVEHVEIISRLEALETEQSHGATREELHKFKVTILIGALIFIATCANLFFGYLRIQDIFPTSCQQTAYPTNSR